MKRKLPASAAWGLVFMGARLSAAQPCPLSDRPIVELVLEVEPPDQIIATTLEQHLRSELKVREIDLCTAPVAPRRPIARVTLHIDHPASGPVIATIRVGDEVTDKRVERVLRLTKLPPDSRAVAVAAATDELLRASWAELAMADAPPPAMPPPSAILRAVASSMRKAPSPPARPRTFELGVVGAASFFFDHREAFGPSATFAWWFHPRLAALLSAEASFGLSRSSAHGSVSANALGVGLGGAFAISPKDAWTGLRAEAAATLMRVAFDTTVAPGATGGSVSDWTVVAKGGLRGWLETGWLRWNLGAAALFALRSVRATDAGSTVTSFEGVGLEVTLGTAVAF